MKRQILSMLIVLILCVTLLPAGAKAAQINGDDPCYKYTPQIVEDVFRYLDEIYVQKYPEMSLRWMEGTDEDKAVLKKLADMITKDCTTDLQKAEAIAGWIQRNIEYDVMTTNYYATEVFYARNGSCAGYAQLMQTLLRLVNVQAVWGDGYRMDTQAVSVDQMYDLMEGHAWCFVRAEGKWYMFDPLWEGSKGLTDKDYISKHYYASRVDLIAPVYDSDTLPPFLDETKAFVYIDGRFRNWVLGTFEHDVSSSYYFVNDVASYSVQNVIYRNGEVYHNCESYIDDPQRTEMMLPGEIFSNGWYHWDTELLTLNGLIHFETVYYAYENGLKPNGIVMEYDGDRYFMSQGATHRFVLEDGDYYINGVSLCLNPDFSGKIIEPLFIKQHKDDPQFYFTWNSSDTSVASVDENGVVTATGKEGFILLEANMHWADNGQACQSEVLYVYFCKDDRVADYTDNVHTCSFERVIEQEPTCTQSGTATIKCQCGKEDSTEVIPAKGHQYSQWNVTHQPTQTQPGEMERICENCNHVQTQTIPAEGTEQPPATEPTQSSSEVMQPSIEVTTDPAPSENEDHSTGNMTDTMVEDFLDPEVNGMDTVFVTPDGLILSAPIELVGGYEGVELVVKLGDEDLSLQAKEMISMFIEEVEAAVSYDISMLSPDGEMVQPIDVVIISIPMPEGWSKERTKVYFVNVEDNYVEDVQYCVSDDGAYVRFATDHFSCYTLVQTVPEHVQKPDQNDEPVVNEFDPTGVIIAATVVILAAAVTVVIFLKKRKK